MTAINSRWYRPRISPLELRKTVLWTAGTVLGAAILWGVLQIPVDIPDTHAGSGASSVAEVNDWVSAGQTFRMDRSGLHRIDVPLSTLKRTDISDLQFYVREEVTGPNLRTLLVSLDKLPEGKVLDLYRTRWQDLPWVSFEFEPLSGYTGKSLYFNVEGKNIARENTVQVLFTYKDSYSRGEGYRSEKTADANMVFRAYARGNLSELLDMTFSRVAARRPGFLEADWLYRGTAMIGVTLVGILLAALVALTCHRDHQ